MLGQIAAACGLTLGQTEAEIGALNPNAALVCQLSGADGLSTWRECAAAVAQLVGGFAAADRAGRLVLRTFAEKPCAALTAAARSEAAVSDFACHYAALSIETDDGSFAAGRSQDTGRKGSARHTAADHRQPVCGAAKAGLRPGHRDDARRPGV